ncbi:unnamed protein product, partial [Laminaria digitata]
TGNSCKHIGYDEFEPGSWPGQCASSKDKWVELNRSICGEGDAYPEEFWACSDISISSGKRKINDQKPYVESVLRPNICTHGTTPSPPPPPLDDGDDDHDDDGDDDDDDDDDDSMSGGDDDAYPTPAPTAEETDPKMPPAPEDPKMTPAPEDPKMTPAPEDPKMTPAPENPKMTPAPEDPKMTPAPEDPKMTPAPEDPKMTPAPTPKGTDPEESESMDPAEGGYEHVGCFADDKGDRVLGSRLTSDDMTAETETCGGYNAFDLYKLDWPEPSSSPEYMDCFADDRSDRVMGDMLVLDTMSTEACREHCSDKNAMYYGTQYSKECWCGTSDVFSDYERHGEGVCHMACSGDPDTACGKIFSFLFLFPFVEVVSTNEYAPSMPPLTPPPLPPSLNTGGLHAFSLFRYMDDNTPTTKPVEPTMEPTVKPTEDGGCTGDRVEAWEQVSQEARTKQKSKTTHVTPSPRLRMKNQPRSAWEQASTEYFLRLLTRGKLILKYLDHAVRIDDLSDVWIMPSDSTDPALASFSSLLRRTVTDRLPLLPNPPFPPPASHLFVVVLYLQCGGDTYKGSSCCIDGYECTVMGAGTCYSQCRPVAMP